MKWNSIHHTCTNFLLDAIITLLTYEAIQEKWTERSQLQHHGWKDMASGAVAGGVGSFLTNPMDVGEFFFILFCVYHMRFINVFVLTVFIPEREGTKFC